jgi:DNA-binding NtrC family response regulator
LRLNHTNSNGNDKHILVVNDEYDIIDVIRFCLRMYGYKACTFTDPLLALDHFKSNSKNHYMVISDITMAPMNGYEFVRKVTKINPEVKAVLMTSFEMSDREFLNVLPDVKIYAFIKKPFSPKIIRNIVVL